MKILTILLIFVSLTACAQTKVQADNYSKAIGVTTQPAEYSVKGKDNSYVEYPVSIQKAGYYIFKLSVSSTTDNSYINIKTPTGKSILASVLIPVGGWQDVSTKVKLTKTTKKLRFVFAGSPSLKDFTYSPMLDTAKPPQGDFVNKADFANLKGQFDNMNKQVGDYKKQIDSLKTSLNTRVIPFDPRFFMNMPDSITVTLRPEILPKK